METFTLNIYLEAEPIPNIECIRFDDLNPMTFIASPHGSVVHEPSVA